MLWIEVVTEVRCWLRWGVRVEAMMGMDLKWLWLSLRLKLWL